MQDGAALRELTAEVRRLSTLIERMAAPRRELNRTDFAAAKVLLPAINRAIGSQSFTLAELVRLARSSLPRGEPLRVAIVAVSGSLDRKSARRLASLARRIAGATVDGLTIERNGREAGGAIYTCRSVAPC